MEPYPEVPVYNTSASIMQQAQEVLSDKGKLNQTAREELETNDGSRPDHHQPYCTAEVDETETNPPPAGCELYCIDQCYKVDETGGRNAAGDPEDEQLGLIVLIVAGVAVVVIAFLLWRRKKSALPEEEEKLLQELKNDL